MESLSLVETPATLDHRFTKHRHEPVERLADSLETSSRDHRLYRVVELENKLKVALIHDAKTDMASVTMNINVGSMSDYKDMPGIAHAVEHVLFMGTKTHPHPDAFQDHVAIHSGRCGAYTTDTSTVYSFQVMETRSDGPDSNESEGEKLDREKFEGKNLDTEELQTVVLSSTTSGDYPDRSSPLYSTLSRFAKFFIEPLFSESTVSREMERIGEEHDKNKQSDLWRLDQLERSLSNPKHPYNHFGTGNYETLKAQPEAKGVNIRDRFMEFHDKYYSANRSQLVVFAKEPLDTLEAWVSSLFSGFQNKNLPQNRWETDVLFGESDLMTQCFVKPVMDSRHLHLSFPFIDEECDYESQASQYITQLIDHEGSGSIMAYIKSMGWATSLQTYKTSICPGTAGMFNCRIGLTEKGLKNYRKIVIVFFEYISLLCESQPQKWFYQELKKMADNRFESEVNVTAETLTEKISLAMGTTLPTKWLLGSLRLRQFDASRIAEGLACLRPGKLRLRIVSQTFPGIWKSKEKWYDTDYTYEKIPAEFFSQLEAAASFKTKNRFSDLHFPHRNDVIVTNMEVKKEDTGPPAVAPKLIRNDDLMRIWHKKDDQFWAPKAAVRLTWRPFNMTTQTSAKARLFANVLLDSLNGCLYNFEIQGFEYSVCGYSEGLEIHLAGYNSKLLVLLEKLLKEIKNLEVKQDRLEVVKENLTRSLENWHFLEPYKQVGTIMQWLNTKNYYIEEQILAELPRVTTTDIRQFYPDFLHQTLVEVLVLGNLDTKAAFDLTHLIESTLGPQTPPMTSTPTSPSLVLPPSSNFVYDRTLKDPKNVNHCIQWYLYAGDGTQRLMRAKVLLLVEMTYVAFFNQLGSEEQLGYITWAHSCSFGDSIGFKCTIQSTKRPEYLESRIDMFLTRFMKTLKDLPPKQFEQHKATLVRKITRKLKDLGEELDSFWSHIKSGDLDFELSKEDAAAINLLTQPDMIEFFERHINPASPERAKIAIHLNAQTPATSGEMTVSEKLDGKEEDMAIRVRHQGNGTIPHIISDVTDFKSKMHFSCGLQPVKDFKEFENF